MQPELLKSLALSRKRNHLVKGDSALDIADKSIGDDEVVDFVTLVGLGVNCPRCGTATECLHEDPLDGRTQERSSGDATVSGLVDEVSRDSRRKMNALWCSPCGDYALSCSLCQMAIRGAGYFCASCGHGGHTGHMREWFEQAIECAAGCGCRCGELAITGHNNASEKDRVLPRDKGSMEYWGGSHSPVKVDFLSEGSRSSNDRDERQSSGKGYFLYDSDNATESTDSKDVSTRSESEYNSDDDDEEYCRNSEDAVDGNTNEQDQRTRTDVDDSYQSFNDWDNEG